MALDIVTDANPPVHLPFGHAFVMPSFRTKMLIGGTCLYREVRVPIWADDAFHKLWKKHARAFSERGFYIWSSNGQWFLGQTIQEHPEQKGTYTLTAAGQDKLDMARGVGSMALDVPKLDLIALPSELEAKLLDYQIEPARQILRALVNGQKEWGYPGAWDCSDLGTGKTYMSLAAALAYAMLINGSVFVVCPLSVIGSDPREGGRGSGWKAAFAHFCAVARGIYNYETLRTGKRDFVKWEHYRGEGSRPMRRFNWTLDPARTVLIFDEAHKCFPAETRIATERGSIPIGEIVKKRLNLRVWTVNPLGKRELRSIKDWHENSMRSLVRVHHTYGYFDCTPDHRVWTASGWCHASELAPGSALLGMRSGLFEENLDVATVLHSSMRGYIKSENHTARNTNSYGKKGGFRKRAKIAACPSRVSTMSGTISAEEHFSTFLQLPMQCAASLDRRRKTKLLRKIQTVGHSATGSLRRNEEEARRENEKEQSHGTRRMPRKNDQGFIWENISLTRRQREANQTANRCGGSAVLADGICDTRFHIDQKIVPESAEELQGGRRESRGKISNRDRWQKSQNEEMEISGPPEDGDFIVSRVDCIEILERVGGFRPPWGAGTDCLYDIEVEGTHCYFANGVLVHNCKKVGTQNQALAMAAMRQRFPTIFISGTLAADPTHMRATGRAVGLHTDGKWVEFLQKNGCTGKHAKGKDWKFCGGRKGDRILQHLHHTVFPARGARIRIEDLGDRFPETQIIVEAFQTGETEKIAKAFREAEIAIERLKRQGDLKDDGARASAMASYMNAWHESERAKVHSGLLEELAEEEMDAGRSVAFFMAFIDTRLELMRRLKTECGIFGTQTVEERSKCIDDFQTDRARVIVCQIAAGGVGVSLHDVQGKHPRTAIILPHNSAEVVRQAFGRVHRAGGRSKSRQIVVFAAGTVEERICNAVRRKMAQITTLVDGDLNPSAMF